MKRKQLKIWLLFLAVGAIFAACEGPEGAAGLNGTDGLNGTNGIDGTDGNATCMACHSTQAKLDIESQFAMSVHAAGAIAVDYAGGRKDCAECHSHQGFVQFAENGAVTGDITNPMAWECATCHSLHQTMEATDYALRMSDPVELFYDRSTSIDFSNDDNSNSNLCANCHQSRSTDPLIADPDMTTYTLKSYSGFHHGPQANILAGTGFVEFEGSIDYPEVGSAAHLSQASCTGCHMAEFNLVDGIGQYGQPVEVGQGGHSFIPTLKSCNDCHSGADLESSDHYDYSGARTLIQAQLDALRDRLVELGTITMTVVDGENVYAAYTGGPVPILHARAYFNWHGIDEDRSTGVHNPKYVRAILNNSLEALVGETAP